MATYIILCSWKTPAQSPKEPPPHLHILVFSGCPQEARQQVGLGGCGIGRRGTDQGSQGIIWVKAGVEAGRRVQRSVNGNWSEDHTHKITVGQSRRRGAGSSSPLLQIRSGLAIIAPTSGFCTLRRPIGCLCPAASHRQAPPSRDPRIWNAPPPRHVPGPFK